MNEYTHNKLYHHGIRGMRWGVRRYQNKDGTLTPAGKKRADKMKEEYTQLTGKKLIRKPNKTPVQNKSVNEMSIKELREMTDRLNAENNYINAVNNRKSLNVQEVTKGKKFVNKIANDVLEPVLTDISKQLVKSFMVKMANQTFKLDDDLKAHTNNKKKN